MPHLMKQQEPSDSFFPGGLFLHANTVPTSFIALIPSPSSTSNSETVSCFSWGLRKRVGVEILKAEGRVCGVFSSLSLSINGSDGDHSYAREEKTTTGTCQERENLQVNGSGAINITKHLWSGAVAAMVSRSSLLLIHFLITSLSYMMFGHCIHFCLFSF